MTDSTSTSNSTSQDPDVSGSLTGFKHKTKSELSDELVKKVKVPLPSKQQSQLEYMNIDSLTRTDDSRKDYGNMEDLCESIKLKGVLQPITVSTSGKILAGRRRHKACEMILAEAKEVSETLDDPQVFYDYHTRFARIPCLVRDIEDDLDALEIEMIENSHRKDMTWQEQATLHYKIHQSYVAKYGDEWSGRKTALLIGKSMGGISQDIQLATILDDIPALKKISLKKDALKIIKNAQQHIQVKENLQEFKDKIDSYGESVESGGVNEDGEFEHVSSGMYLDPISHEIREIKTPNKASADSVKSLVSPPKDSEDEGSSSSSSSPLLPKTKALAFFEMAEHHYKVRDVFEEIARLNELYNETDEDGTPPIQSRLSLLEVDPPYGIDLNNAKRSATEEISSEYNEIEADEYLMFLEDLCGGLYSIAATDAWCIFWYGPTWHAEVKSALKNAGWVVDDIPAIWNKGSGQTNAPEYYLARSYEPFFIARKGSPKLNKMGIPNVFDFPPVNPSQKIHPTQRPIELIERLYDIFLMPNSTIFIPFLGSGTSIRAAYRTNNAAFGCDLSEEYKEKFLDSVANDPVLRKL